MKINKRVNDTQVKIQGIDILNREMGPVMALRFLSLLHREPTDYVNISRKIYKNQSVDDIFLRAKKNWKG
jgi:hypothetical protein